jgi:hypothetical protein
VKIIPSKNNEFKEIKEIKEEDIEESVDSTQVKKINLKIIIPDVSNDGMEPSTSGSSNIKNQNANSPIILQDKNSFNFPKNYDISNISEISDINNINNISSRKKNLITPRKRNLIRTSTPVIKKHKSVYNPPFTYDDKNFKRRIFNYNFETKNNGIIIPKEEKKLNINNNFFNDGYKNKKMKYNKSNSKMKLNSNSSRLKNILEANKESSINSPSVSIYNNINQKTPIKSSRNISDKYNNYKKDKNETNIKKNKKSDYFKENIKQKGRRPNSIKNNTVKYINLTRCNDMNDLSKEKRRNHSNKNDLFIDLNQKKLKDIRIIIKNEINNLFQILPDDFEKYPDIINNIELIYKNLHGLKDYIYKNTQNYFGKNANCK